MQRRTWGSLPSTVTVERHITSLYRKIGARSRADATAYALRQGVAENAE